MPRRQAFSVFVCNFALRRNTQLVKKTKAYAKAGVDVDLGNRVKASIPKLVQQTRRPEVLGAIGGFGGLFRAAFRDYRDPILVSSVDGVGTKLKVAAMTGRHDTVGEDLVNHCVNDIAVMGADPLFFLDYIGLSKLSPIRFRDILKGVVRGCKANHCALVGGETAQMPGLYHGDDYDLVGCIVGVVDRPKIIDGSRIQPGDAILGLPSSGLHTNGYSLARKIIFDQLGFSVKDKVPGTQDTVGQALLRTHLSYWNILKKIRSKIQIKGLAHITGGGLVDNLPRVLPKRTNALIRLGTWPVPQLFRWLSHEANLGMDELYQTFNMGIGMTVIVNSKDVSRVLQMTRAYEIGTITRGTGCVDLEPCL